MNRIINRVMSEYHLHEDLMFYRIDDSYIIKPSEVFTNNIWYGGFNPKISR